MPLEYSRGSENSPRAISLSRRYEARRAGRLKACALGGEEPARLLLDALARAHVAGDAELWRAALGAVRALLAYGEVGPRPRARVLRLLAPARDAGAAPESEGAAAAATAESEVLVLDSGDGGGDGGTSGDAAPLASAVHAKASERASTYVRALADGLCSRLLAPPTLATLDRLFAHTEAPQAKPIVVAVQGVYEDSAMRKIHETVDEYGGSVVEFNDYDGDGRDKLETDGNGERHRAARDAPALERAENLSPRPRSLSVRARRRGSRRDAPARGRAHPAQRPLAG